jgi:RimJ/RimL family protein N-acetyltransferase
MSARPLPSAVGPTLSAEVLARARALPKKPAPVTLVEGAVTLRPLDLDRDLAPLFERSSGRAATLGDRSIAAYDSDAAIWRYLSAGPFADAPALGALLGSQVAAVDGLCFAVLLDEAPVGVANYLANHPEHLKIELGSIWYSPLVQGAGVNARATFLMLEHAFAIGYRRVEWKCDALNERSRRAALRMGFTFEGIQDAHFIVKGRSRDTAWFRVLDREWPDVAVKLRALF